MIEKIFHVSDIHTRLLQRHPEYKKVFEELFSYIRGRLSIHPNSIIVLTGDIAHSKADMSPEMTDVISDFLKDCAELCPTFLIAGNHDFNGNNSSRMDVLYPIVKTLNLPNLYYLRESQVFEYHDIAFGVFSIIGDNELWPHVPDTKCSTKIALYHGPVYGSSSDIGYVFTDHALSVETFKEYDITLLGDIHKHQFLTPTMAYPGSLIQQNFGESLVHGIIEWDIPSRVGTYIPIKQHYAYVTLSASNGFKLPDNLPDTIALRINHDGCTPEQLGEIVAAVRTKTTVEVVSDTNNNIQSGDVKDIDVSNKASRNDAITEYLKSKGADATTVQAIINFHAKVESKASEIEYARNVEWWFDRLWFDNMFSYGVGNVFDAAKLRGLVGLFAANTAGKSSLIDIMTYLIYDKCSRTSLAKEVLNSTSEYFSCAGILNLSGKKYQITRAGKKSNSGNVSVDVKFYEVNDDGEVVADLTGGRRDETNKIIRSYFGTYDDFVLTTVSTQVDNRTIIDYTQKERQELLYRFMDVDIFNIYEKIGKDELKDTQLKVYKLKKDYPTLLADLDSKITYATDEVQNAETLKYDVQTMIHGLTENIQKLRNTKHNIVPIDIASVQRQLDARRTEHATTLTRLAELEDKKVLIKTEYGEKVDALKGFDEAKYNENVLTIQNINVEIAKVQNKLRNVISECTKLESDIKMLDAHKYDPNCVYCVDNVFVKNAEKAKALLPEKLAERIQYEGLLESYNAEVTTFTTYITENQHFLEVKKKIDSLMNEAKQVVTLQESLENLVKVNSELIVKYEADVATYVAQEKLIQENIKIDVDIAEVDKMLNACNLQLHEYIATISRCTNGILQYNKEKSELLKSELEFAESVEDERINLEYIDMCGRNGLPYFLLKKCLPIIESEVNSILEKISPFTLKVRTGDNDAIDISIGYVMGDERSVSLCSGMERFIVSMALRSALLQITSLPKPTFIIIDEGFGVLDSENLPNISLLFNYLKTRYSFILCISHIDAMKSMMDTVIPINKNSGYSHIMLD